MSAGQALKEAVTGQQRPQRTGYEIFRDKLAQIRKDLRTLLGSDQAVARFERVVLNAVQQTPDLLLADGRTLMLACMKAAQDRLLPDGREAVLNIYNTKVKTPEGERWVKQVQYLPMVRGLIKLLWDTDLFLMLDAVAVYQKDYFEYRRGDEPRIHHEPYAGEDDPGPVVAAYFIGKMKGGEIKREVMFRRDIEKARAVSKTGGQGPWVAWYDQMAIKSVVHRVYKQLPSIPEFESVLANDVGINTSAPVTTAFESSAGQSGAPALPEHAGGEPAPSFHVPAEGEYIPAGQESIDASTGEITQATSTDPQPAQQQQQAGSAPDARQAFEDACKLVAGGKYDDARAICPAAQQQALEDMITNRETNPQAAAAATQRSVRRATTTKVSGVD